MSAEVKRLVPIPDARGVLGGIGHTTIYDLINRGELTKVNIGRRSFITSESIAAFMDRLSNAKEQSSAADKDAACTAPRAPTSQSRTDAVASKLAELDASGAP